MADFKSLVETKLEPVGVSGNDTIYCCPHCDDKSGHLYINYDKGYFNCFKCALSGKRIEKLLKVLNIDTNYDYEKLYSEQDKELDAIINPTKKVVLQDTVDYSTDLDTLTIYYNMHTQPLTPEAFHYLLRRGLTIEMISTLGIREGVSRYGESLLIKGKEWIGRDYSGRIMVPSLRKDGRISFYVGRDYTGAKDPKYLNPPKELGAASEDVWSLDIIDTASVVICEGVFTAIAVDKALGKKVACATYGKSIAQRSSNDSGIDVTSQGEKLLSKKFHTYIVFYDKDARKEAYDTAKYLYDRGARVRVVNITTDKYGPKADAADMSIEEVINSIRDSEDFNPFSGIL